MSELPPRIEASEPEDEPTRTHLHEFDYEIKDWWRFNCNTVTDFCVELNDFGQGEDQPNS